MEETHFLYWLSSTPGIGLRIAHKLISYAGSAAGAWSLSARQLSSQDLGLPISTQNLILESKNEADILSSYAHLSDIGVRFIPFTDPDFPFSLKGIFNAPIGIYLKGSLPERSLPSIAIVGARTCSEYGRYTARKIAEHLASYNFPIISGLARGIDVIAQKAALDAGGYSCAVLGCGIDICYPSENQATYSKLQFQGGIISEYPPGTLPKAGLFPMRNRIISALSDVVVIIEAREKSGSLITADLALEQGKEVYALPGRVTDSLSHGTNRLIRQGAGIILSPEEFVADLSVNYSLGDVSEPTVSSPSCKQLSLSDLMPLNSHEKQIISVVDMTPQSIGSIQAQTSLPLPTLMEALMSLSMRGMLNQIGGYYTRN